MPTWCWMRPATAIQLTGEVKFGHTAFPFILISLCLKSQTRFFVCTKVIEVGKLQLLTNCAHRGKLL